MDPERRCHTWRPGARGWVGHVAGQGSGRGQCLCSGQGWNPALPTQELRLQEREKLSVEPGWGQSSLTLGGQQGVWAGMQRQGGGGADAPVQDPRDAGSGIRLVEMGRSGRAQTP